MTKMLGPQAVGRGLGDNVWLQGTNWATSLPVGRYNQALTCGFLWQWSPQCLPLMYSPGSRTLHLEAAPKETDSRSPRPNLLPCCGAALPEAGYRCLQGPLHPPPLTLSSHLEHCTQLRTVLGWVPLVQVAQGSTRSRRELRPRPWSRVSRPKPASGAGSAARGGSGSQGFPGES